MTLTALTLVGCKRDEASAVTPVPGLDAMPSAAPSSSGAAAPPAVMVRPGDAPLTTVHAFRSAISRGERARALGYFRREDAALATDYVDRMLRDPDICRRPLAVRATRALGSAPKRTEIEVTEGPEALTYFLELQDGIWKLDQAAARKAALQSLAGHLHDAGYSDAAIERGIDLAVRVSRPDAGRAKP